MPRLLTLPQLAWAIGVEYRTLHSWVGKGIVSPSIQSARGAGIPNLFSPEDAVKAKVIAGLREGGASFEQLASAAEQLDRQPRALHGGAVVLVNGSVSVVAEDRSASAIAAASPALVYRTAHAVSAVEDALATLDDDAG